jgi:hypothetical protein
MLIKQVRLVAVVVGYEFRSDGVLYVGAPHRRFASPYFGWG